MTKLVELKQGKLVAVIRGARPDQIVPIARALNEGGIRTLEITVETPKVCELIDKVKEEFGDDIIVGAGTVLDPETARSVIMAGAEFIFSPTVNIETIKMAKRYGIISIPGALTPTEILTAYEHGADVIKVFPADALGVGYFKNLKGPLPHIPLMPTGGVNLDNLASFLKAGAVAAGIGGSLINPKKLLSEEDYTELEETAKKFSAIVQNN
ncbi:bifunctional 4-hydroxy-2-oxoglutarate aldolase/2-dehydro-3-deoxy-phosphogluconate aldolase [Peribacillus butanolivorans]|uniref:bifunctional 4-hydroxy-2-oxoglutarate aldolase/2-dehydro-3-deoxy-phosphogluconate aldolase n=1 Tax=Peribacillus TaxID=2675229 RepID=UPI0006A6FC87|nr:bifunctional 4-hydroxy-2-oxoglutarate aldolase/2-dehydro-3-deoxy-phosphogluconate aldolase [Peribacillus butanolivorans]KON69557.1 2-dehydro-3-deoxyphosphogluconate aldolase [Peribacillus butanolivorans]KQU25579.1 2-dehydro-3-deoxyphosphogluconate aldolase [Bacillus sp. Leaf13]MCO0598589.1 bifunctional 4-hydroxy-2-oxoglutarate aldolase/2-dehydro-3-deoxy-phosphogluconate aldolase [Peribacillus butanolivorans]